MKNRWKLLFFLHLGINFSIILFLIILIHMPNHEESRPFIKEEIDGVVLKVNSRKEDLNQIINHYIEEEDINNPIDYQVVLKNEVELYGMIKVFSENVDVKLTFEPTALQNGDLMLKQKSISIGQLELPVSYVMRFMKEQYEFPEWINIQPNDELVYVALTKMKLKSDMRVQVERFDLKNNDISFALIVPTKENSH